MQLSYTCRLFCLAFAGAGLMQFALESASWALAPRFLRRSSSANPRRAERSLFLFLLFVRLSPWLVVLGAWLPAYMREEDNLSPEHIGLAAIIAASCFLCVWLIASLRTVAAWIQALRFSRKCEPTGITSPDGLPILLHPGTQPLLAVAGIFRSRILISGSLLPPGQIPSAALEVALLHEGAHARHHDNLKRFILSLLPHVPIATSAKPSLDHHWQLAAEIAADDAGAQGIPERSILLADLLVKMARGTMPSELRGAFALLSNTNDLRVRIERLLPAEPPLSNGTAPSVLVKLQAPAVLAIAAAALATLCYLGLQAGHRLSEILLHIG